MKRQFVSSSLVVIAIFVAIGLCVPEASGQQQGVGVASGPLRFEERLVLDEGEYIFGIAALDVDGDGDLDLTSTDATYNIALFWYENDGRGNLTKRVLAKDDPGWYERHVGGDVNGDGHLDIVVAKGQFGELLWLENSGTPADGMLWRRHVIASSFPRAYDVALADLDNDGDLDLAASAFTGNSFAWFENSARSEKSGQWTKHVVDEDLGETRMMVTADIDRDGRIDLLGTERMSNVVVWYKNPGAAANGQWQRHVIDDETVQPVHGHPVDLDEDGDMDLVMASGMRVDPKETNSHQVSWFENVGQPGVGAEWKKWVIGKVRYGFEVVPGDLDGDGDLDLIATGESSGNPGAGEVSWFENPGDPKSVWAKHGIKRNWEAANQVIVMDLDNDGRLDIVACTEQATVLWWRNLGRVPSSAATSQ